MTLGIPARRVAPTLEAVAAEAGVSRSTVSRVVNGSPHVSPEVARAVTAAIERLHYVPNRAARSLANRQTSAIALVVPENTAKFFADPYFASVIQGAAMHLSSTEYTLTLLIASETDSEKTRRYLQGGNVDGARRLSHHSDDSFIHRALASNPCGLRGPRGEHRRRGDAGLRRRRQCRGRPVGCRAGLIASGRRCIATIAGPTNMTAGLDRLEGWKSVMADAGLPTDLVEHGDFTPASGAAAMERLLDRGEPIDGLFAASAQMADGALSVLRQRGLVVPRDLGVVTFDDDYFAERATPPLTTVNQDEGHVGRAIAEVLIRSIEGEDVPRVTIMPTRVINRRSQ